MSSYIDYITVVFELGYVTQSTQGSIPSMLIFVDFASQGFIVWWSQARQNVRVVADPGIS